jgi:hypothetical protein
MANTQVEALKLALEALKEITLEHGMTEKARTAIKAALEAKDEPVAWMRQDGQRVTTASDRHNYPDYETRYSIPLYTTPPQRKPLTEIALLGAYEEEQQGRWGDHVRGLRAIEAAHGIKGEA